MRIAHITTVDLSLRYLLLNQLASLRDAGYDVAGISAPGPDVVVVEAEGIRHIAIPMSRQFTPLADAVSLWRLYRAMRRERFTIVHTHTPKPGLLGQVAARLAGVPIVVNTLHGFYFHDHMHPAWRRFYILMEKIAASCSDVILSQNTEDMRTAIREGICREAKIKYLGNGIDLSVFDPSRFSPSDIAARRNALGIASDALVVGFVGRLAARRKGFLDFLHAARIISDRIPEARFLIIGEADRGKEDTVEPSKAEELGIAHACLFLGKRPNAELPLLYSMMNVLALPSIFEGMPRVVMEAAAMGIPAVVTDVKGNREVVEHGRTGLHVPFGSAPALADAILALLTDRDKARRMGDAARRMALERFDEREVFRKVQNEYARLLVEKGLVAPARPAVR